MSIYRVVNPTYDEVMSAVQSALSKIGLDCGYEISIKLLNNAVMKMDNETMVANGGHLIVPETVAKEFAAVPKIENEEG